jgi:hypothetical protein
VIGNGDHSALAGFDRESQQVGSMRPKSFTVSRHQRQ